MKLSFTVQASAWLVHQGQCCWMADLSTAPTAIDFQQDLFHELGLGTGHSDEDELWGTISFFGPFHFLCTLLSYSPLFLCPLYFGISAVLAELRGRRSLRANKVSPVGPPLELRSPPMWWYMCLPYVLTLVSMYARLCPYWSVCRLHCYM